MKKKKILILIVLLIIFQFTPPARLFQSMSIMSIYSKIHEKNSLFSDLGIYIKIPGGLKTSEDDWYPFVMTFNDDSGFKEFTGNDNLRLTIMYNFPAFSLLKGNSLLYDVNSPYYNSFYGAYAVQDVSGKPYGFINSGENLTLNYEAVSEVPLFDFQELVLGDFGLEQEDMVFDWNIVSSEDSIPYAGIEGWTVTNAELTVNGSAHNYNGFVQSYLQYGIPSKSVSTEFEPVNMVGRVYSKYLKENNCSIFFYIIAPNESVLENCDDNILSMSTIKF